MKVEVFVSDCPLCEQTLRVLYEAAPPTGRVTVHRCYGECCCEAAQRYELYTVLPAVVVNERVVWQGRLTPKVAEKLFGQVEEAQSDGDRRNLNVGGDTGCCRSEKFC